MKCTPMCSRTLRRTSLTDILTCSTTMSRQITRKRNRRGGRTKELSHRVDTGRLPRL